LSTLGRVTFPARIGPVLRVLVGSSATLPFARISSWKPSEAVCELRRVRPVIRPEPKILGGRTRARTHVVSSDQHPKWVQYVLRWSILVWLHRSTRSVSSGRASYCTLVLGSGYQRQDSSGFWACKSNPQLKIDWALGILATSGLLPILGFVSYYFCLGSWTTWMIPTMIAIFLLWPVSAVLAIWGTGVGRLQLLVGHGLIALLMASLLLTAWIHGWL
jgi:hypothetical protein